MYNFSANEKIPFHLPVALSVSLKPWFDTVVLEKGLALLRDRELCRFFFHRHVAAALFRDASSVTIVYERTHRIAQGFTLQTEHCQLCGFSRRKTRCEHVAALCLLSLIETEESRFFPMPLLFRESRWGKLAAFLHDWLGGEKGNLERFFREKSLRLKRTATEGGVFVRLSDSTTQVWEIFAREGDLQQESSEIFILYRSIQELTKSDTEKELSAAGSASRAFIRDSSLWSRLCTLFYGLGGDKQLSLSHEEELGLFCLEFHNRSTNDQLKIHLPRHRTQEILGQLGFRELGITSLPPAHQGFQVTLDTKGVVKVIPMIRLEDQRVFLLSEIVDRKFGNSYFFPGEGFLQLKKHDPAGKICQPRRQQSANPLFDFVEKDAGFVIAENVLHGFLKENRLALSHPDNLVDPDIFTLQVKNVPDSLIINEFKEDQDWYYLSCDYGLGDSSISLEDLLRERETTDALYIGKTSLQLGHGPLSWFHNLAARQAWIDSNGRKGVRLSPSQFMSLITIVEDVRSKLKDSGFHDRLETILDRGSWGDPTRLPRIPAHFRDYQKNGLAWLHTLHELGLGGLLADDMGLGKTHQGLGLLELVGGKKETSPMLVICPASVLPHWCDKIDQFYPDLNYSVYYGANRDLSAALQSGLLITTYGVARSDREPLSQIPFEIILLDEIQILKNRRTEIHKAVSSFISRIKIGLSGTPIENSLTDLYSLFDICLPGFFGSMEHFNRTYLKPITEGQDKEQKDRLSKLVDPFILRRSRVQVLGELPPLIEDNRKCELSEDQVRLYRQTLGDQSLFLESLESGNDKIDYLNILTIITRLKQICNHPCLLEKCTDPSKYQSGKWDLFVELLEESLESGRKVVVFSQYTGMLDIMKHYLEGAGIAFSELRGSMSVGRRAKMIDKFTREKGCRVFCSSLLAGGTGIDLLAGQVVIHYDRWWNPAKEEQATARVHRMGQKDVVQLFRLITIGTLEEKIHGIIAKKQLLASAIIKEDESGLIKQLDRNQLMDLFMHSP